MPSPPLVSVVVTCYNRQAYLAQALDSIIAQRCSDCEIVLVDDGSSDASARIAAEYVERHRDRLRYHRQANQGAAAAKNAGVRLAAGRYLAFLDSDDLWTPDKLQVQLGDAASRPEIRIRYAHGRQFISPELEPEQRARLQERVDDPDKNWKFNPGDLEERKFWPQYMEAYEDVLSKTSTEYAPWYVIPSNKKWYRNLLIANILRDTLKGFKMSYPEPPADLEGYHKKLLEMTLSKEG